MPSKTTVRPSCSIKPGSAADCLMIAPPGAEVAAQHRDAALRIDRIGEPAHDVLLEARTGAFDLVADGSGPVTVRASRRSSGFSSRSRVAMPPALWKSSM
jgi:hypothetical protein